MASSRIRGIRQAIPAGTVLARTGIGKGPPAAVKIGALLGGAGASGAAFVRANQTKDTNVVGTTTNDDATAGNIGEYITAAVAIGSEVSVTSGAAFNLTSISLTAGDWDVSGAMGFDGNAGTVRTSAKAWASSVSASAPADMADAQGIVMDSSDANSGQDIVLPTGVRRFSLATTTTIYFSGYAVFSVSTLFAYGRIRARRVR